MNELIEKYIHNFGKTNPALDKFAKIGFPDKNLESWKYTPIQNALEPVFLPNPPKEIDSSVKQKKSRIVLFNGIFSKELSSLPQGVEILEKKETHKSLDIEDSFELLNIGLCPLSIEIKIQQNFQDKLPLEIFHWVTESAKEYIITPNLKINVGKFSKTHILETFVGPSNCRYFTNAITEINLNEGSTVEYVKAVNESPPSLHIGKVRANCAKDSNFKNFTFSFGGKLIRNNIEIGLLEEGASALANGVYALSKNQICDNFSLINHAVANTTSNQLFKGILDNESHGIFTGQIRVNPDAQKINSEQLAKGLLLSKKAHINARPILEIYADDVKCSHGAAIGQLNPEEIFYLESRGLTKLIAMKILCRGFALEGVDLIESPSIKREILGLLEEKLKELNEGIFDEKI